MMRRMTLYLLIVVLLVCIITTAVAGGISIGTNTEAVYQEMIVSFTLDDSKNSTFADTITFYCDHPELEEYKDSQSYYRYMLARADLVTGKYDESEMLFQTLAGFLNSDQYLHYVSGLIAEGKKNYIDAVRYYTEAGDLVPLERLTECKQKEAEESQSTAYQEALDLYQKCMNSEDADGTVISQCRERFLKLGGYLQAAEYAKKCDEWLQQLNRRILVSSINATAESITLEWTDNGNCAKYTVLYRSYGNIDWLTIEYTEKKITINGLIPDTLYELRIEDASLSAVCASAEGRTALCPRNVDTALCCDGFRILGLNKTALGKRTVDEIINNRTFVLEPEKKVFTAAETADYALYLSVSISNTAEEESFHEIRLVLRSTGYGTYATDSSNISIPGKITYRTLNCDMSSLLDTVRSAYGSLPADEYMVDLLVDGSLFTRASFSIE